MRKMKDKRFSNTYCLLVIARLILTISPQNGYIHPDEFFQNVEILAGRVFDLETNTPWEFNVTAPIRSIGPSYITIGFSYHILKLINAFIEFQFGLSLLSPYWLVVTPRVVVCSLSFLIDYALCLICTKNNEKFTSRLTLLASSYVMLVYSTRTFTNSLESILFALLLYFVADSMIFSNIVVRQREYLNKRFDRAENPTDRVKLHKLRLFLASDSYKNCFSISTIVVVGFFNRPTFLCYALFPIFFWLYRGIGSKSVNTLQFNARIVILGLCAMPSIIFFVIVDSFFYGYLTWGEIGMLDISINNFVFPPWNFIKYNIQSSNLAKHGLHPRWFHIFVNIPLLFNILGILSIINGINIIYKLLHLKFNLLPTVRSVRGLMTMSYIAPTIFLSYFPHQEPRFLLPIVLPLIYLFSHKIYDEEDGALAYFANQSQIKANQQSTEKIQSENGLWRNSASSNDYSKIVQHGTKENSTKPKGETRRKKQHLYKIWLAVNILLTIFYGFLHQAGVLQAAAYLSREMHSKPHFSYHIVTSHIYSIPHIFYMQPNNERLHTQGNIKYKLTKHVFTYEEGSKDLYLLLKQMETISIKAIERRLRFRMFLLMSGSKHDDLSALFASSVLDIRFKEAFYPHISTEALPSTKIYEFIELASGTKLGDLSWTYLGRCLKDILFSFDLKLYEVHNTMSNTTIIKM